MHFFGAKFKIKILHPQKHSISYGYACNYQSSHSNVEAILLSALPKETTRKLAGLSRKVTRLQNLAAIPDTVKRRCVLEKVT